MVALMREVRRMRREHPSSWLVAWSRVKTMRSPRVRRYLRVDADERRAEYPWLYRD